MIDTFLGGGNSNIFYFRPEPWGNNPIWRAYFWDGVVQPPTRKSGTFYRMGFFSGSKSKSRPSGMVLGWSMGFFGFPTVERLKGRSAYFCVARLKETYPPPPRKLRWQRKIHHEWRSISYWKWWFCNVMLVFRGVYNIQFYDYILDVAPSPVTARSIPC